MTTSPAGVPGRPLPGDPGLAASGPSTPFDPLRLCIFTTVALLAWVFGPLAVLVFASIGLAGYWRAHRAGLTRSRCYLRDVRLVLAYLAVIAAAAVAGIAWTVHGWLA
ncbi:hypothetical protein [Longivirga aurantiaca]|uniref:Uncharacterized protein n=1 Tax=Longivirga aurantiaca TaxID=1837743 RepID=A0ABW1T1H6_9ACTN